MNVPRLLQVVVIVGTLGTAARASDPVFPPAESFGSAGLFEGTDTVRHNAGSDDSGSQPPRVSNRRDRIFYPGDTERPQPLLQQLFLNILLAQTDLFTSPSHVDRPTHL